MSNKDELTIEFEPGVLADIFTAIHLCEVEISGLARVERCGRKFKVFGDAIIFNQTCSLAETEPDAEALNLHFNSIAASGDEDKIKDMESQTLWWHSHVWHRVIFSGTDLGTMKRILSGFYLWWLVMVLNKYNQTCLALIEKGGGFMKYEEAPIILNPKITDEEFRELISARIDVVQDIIKRRVIVSGEGE